jgi:Acyl-CoA carboxylase epsilon subunit
VVRGSPSDVEIAALTVVLAAVASAPLDPSPPSGRDRWSDPTARFRSALHPGPAAWRTSAWPR